jgi:hypothetical protein
MAAILRFRSGIASIDSYAGKDRNGIRKVLRQPFASVLLSRM